MTVSRCNSPHRLRGRKAEGQGCHAELPSPQLAYWSLGTTRPTPHLLPRGRSTSREDTAGGSDRPSTARVQLWLREIYGVVNSPLQEEGGDFSHCTQPCLCPADASVQMQRFETAPSAQVLHSKRGERQSPADCQSSLASGSVFARSCHPLQRICMKGGPSLTDLSSISSPRRPTCCLPEVALWGPPLSSSHSPVLRYSPVAPFFIHSTLPLAHLPLLTLLPIVLVCRVP